MLHTLPFFSSKCSLFHNANLFGSCIIHILYTGCAEIKKKNNSGAKGLMYYGGLTGLNGECLCKTDAHVCRVVVRCISVLVNKAFVS